MERKPRPLQAKCDETQPLNPPTAACAAAPYSPFSSPNRRARHNAPMRNRFHCCRTIRQYTGGSQTTNVIFGFRLHVVQEGSITRVHAAGDHKTRMSIGAWAARAARR